MYKIIITLVLLWVENISFSQTSFYIRPTLIFKNNTNLGGTSFYSENVKPLSNSYVNHINRRFNVAQEMNLGGVFGLKFLDKHSFEIEYYRESMTLGFITDYYIKTLEEYQGYNNFNQTQEGLKIGLATNKFGLLYRNSLCETSNKLFEFHFNLGLGMYINSKQKDGNYRYLNVEKNYESPIKELENGVVYEGYEYTIGFSKGLGGYGIVGLGFELNTKRKNVICFDLNYTQGFRRIFSSIMSYKFDVNQEKVMYTTFGGTRGSSLNVQISYRFQLYPWIKSKRKELQEQGIYKSRD